MLGWPRGPVIGQLWKGHYCLDDSPSQVPVLAAHGWQRQRFLSIQVQFLQPLSE